MTYIFKILSQKYGKAIQIVVSLIVLFCTCGFSCESYDKAFKVYNYSNIELECHCIQDTVSEYVFMSSLTHEETIQPHSKAAFWYETYKGNIFDQSPSGIITIILIDRKKAHDPKINPFAESYFHHITQFSKYICIVYEVDIFWMEEHDWIITYPFPNDPNVKYVRSVNGILTTSVDNFGPHFPSPIED